MHLIYTLLRFVAQLLHPVFMTATLSKSMEFSFDPVTGNPAIARGKLIKEYLNVSPFNMVFSDKQKTPLV